MAGDNDRIHGYNPIYRVQKPVNFHSFDLDSKTKPTNFIYQKVSIDGPGVAVDDHQGHIVPQKTLNIVLNPLMESMAKSCKNLPDVKNFIKNSWMQSVYDYGEKIGAPMFDFEDSDPETKVGGFFSIVTWNPVNICRAPEDKKRNGVPGNTIDTQVEQYLAAHKDQQGVNTAWLSSLQTLMKDDKNKDKITDYIVKCSDTLSGQLTKGIGYYAFPWKYTNNILNPV